MIYENVLQEPLTSAKLNPVCMCLPQNSAFHKILQAATRLLYFNSELYPCSIRGTSSFKLYVECLGFSHLKFIYICKFWGRKIIYVTSMKRILSSTSALATFDQKS